MKIIYFLLANLAFLLAPTVTFSAYKDWLLIVNYAPESVYTALTKEDCIHSDAQGGFGTKDMPTLIPQTFHPGPSYGGYIHGYECWTYDPSEEIEVSSNLDFVPTADLTLDVKLTGKGPKVTCNFSATSWITCSEPVTTGDSTTVTIY